MLGSLLRALGLLLLRAPGEALDEVAAVASTYLRLRDIRNGRARRKAAAEVSARDVRHLLPPPWLPYRHGMDLVGEVAVAVTREVSEASARRESRAREGETGPLPAGREGPDKDTGQPFRLLRSPVAWLIAVLVVVSVVADRGRLGVGRLAGGALLPAPGGAGDWWHLYLESWHDVGVGSGAPAVAYLLPMALLSSLLFGKAWLLVDLLFLLAVPAAAIGAHRFLRLVTRGAAAPLWGALAYGLLPVLSGSVQQGRLGSVVGVLILPWLARSAVFLAPGQPSDRRHRAAWRTSLWLALLCSFVPLAWVLATATAVVAVAVGARGDRRRWISGAVVGPVVLPLVVSAVLLLPWSLLTWASGGSASLLFEAGLPAPQLTVAPGPWDLVLGRPGSAGAPAWLGIGVAVAALLALLRPDTRPAVLRAWTVLVVALVVTVVVAPGRHAVPGSPVEQPVWLGFPILLAQAAGNGCGPRR